MISPNCRLKIKISKIRLNESIEFETIIFRIDMNQMALTVL